MIENFFLLLGGVFMISHLNGNVSLSNENTLFSHFIEERNFDDSAYPIVKPRTEGYVQVSDLHKLFYAAYGNPNGIPVVILHGGPGGGCDDTMVQFFDLTRWNVIMFDQRGAMRSEPFGSLEENTPKYLVNDIEIIKNFFKIEKWVVFGGSWGSSLSLLYAQEYPDSCLGLILRGAWLAREQDYLHLFYGMGKIFPEAYAVVVQHIPEEERDDLFSAYCDRIFDSNPEIHLPAARIFMQFDAICSTHCPNPSFVEEVIKNDKLVLGVMRIFFHYAKNKFFLKSDQILSNMHKITHLPSIIVQGRYDVVCFPEIAYSLYQNWKGSNLWMIPNGGHSDDEPPMMSALVAATNLFMKNLEELNRDNDVNSST
jgi:proline iminopeptidase